VCVVRRDHAGIGASLSMREFGLAPQVHTAAVPTMRAWIDAQLRKRGLESGPRMMTQHVSAMPFIVAASDYVAMIPREVFDLFAPIAPLRMVRLPAPIPSVAIHLYWHPRVASDPAVNSSGAGIGCSAGDAIARAVWNRPTMDCGCRLGGALAKANASGAGARHAECVESTSAAPRQRDTSYTIRRLHELQHCAAGFETPLTVPRLPHR
jgi:hypothetical protein